MVDALNFTDLALSDCDYQIWMNIEMDMLRVSPASAVDSLKTRLEVGHCNILLLVFHQKLHGQSIVNHIWRC